jgi:two pore calcium channel protein
VSSLILEWVKIPGLKASVFIATIRLLRLMRFIRYFAISKRLRVIAGTFLTVVPLAMVQFAIVLLWYYGYGEIGMYLFGGKLVRENEALNGTDYKALNFYEVSNFNNIINSFLTQYHLTVVNNWHVTMRAGIAVTSRWAVIYFVVFWLMTIIILMNLVVATVLDVFSEQLGKVEEEDTTPKQDTTSLPPTPDVLVPEVQSSTPHEMEQAPEMEQVVISQSYDSNIHIDTSAFDPDIMEDKT